MRFQLDFVADGGSWALGRWGGLCPFRGSPLSEAASKAWWTLSECELSAASVAGRTLLELAALYWTLLRLECGLKLAWKPVSLSKGPSLGPCKETWAHPIFTGLRWPSILTVIAKRSFNLHLVQYQAFSGLGKNRQADPSYDFRHPLHFIIRHNC